MFRASPNQNLINFQFQCNRFQFWGLDTSFRDGKYQERLCSTMFFASIKNSVVFIGFSCFSTGWNKTLLKSPQNAERGERSEPSEAATGRHVRAQTNLWIQVKPQQNLFNFYCNLIRIERKLLRASPKPESHQCSIRFFLNLQEIAQGQPKPEFR